MEKRGERVFLLVDSNILFSYFMLSQKIRNLMLSSKVTLYTPDWAIHELNIVLDIMQKLIVVPKALYIGKWDEAIKIAEQFDVKDTPFIASSLNLNIPIWTNDKGMIKYGLISEKYLALDTEALENLLKGKSLEEIKEDLRKKFL